MVNILNVWQQREELANTQLVINLDCCFPVLLKSRVTVTGEPYRGSCNAQRIMRSDRERAVQYKPHAQMLCERADFTIRLSEL